VDAERARIANHPTWMLSWADELKENTIDAILRKEDAELAIDVLTGKIPPPQ
jgi:hypothetical protein